MAFPTTGIIDDANRADESPAATTSSGATWGGSVYAVGANTLKVLSNQLVTQSNGGGTDYISSATYGPDCEAYVDVPTITSGDSFGVWLRGSSFHSGSTESGYLIQGLGANTYRFFRDDADSFTQLGSTGSQTWASGDSVGADIVGSSPATLTIYRKTGGTWSAVDTRTDSTYTAAGRIGVDMFNNVGSLIADNFGGGTIPGATVTPPLPMIVDTAVTRAASY